MTERPPIYFPASWQVLLADLSLILFITTATTVAVQPVSLDGATVHRPRTEKIYSSFMSGEDIGEWLAAYTRDPRERLWITIHYRRGDFASAVQRASQLEASASAVGQTPHIALEQSEKNRTTAFFAYNMPHTLEDDTSAIGLARGLH